MSEEHTCGTCGHSEQILDCMMVIPDGPVIVSKNGTCPKWTERTDSLEQVALDMLGFVSDCASHYPYADCDNCPENTATHDRTRYDLGKCTAPETYRNRLRALGFEVSE